MITKQKREELAIFHQEFLQSPVAQQIRRLLLDHEAMLADKLAEYAIQVDAVNDQIYRQYGTQLKTTKVIRELIFDNETFVEKSTK